MMLISAFIVKLGKTCVVVYFYVDDILIFRTILNVICETKKFLGFNFDTKDLRRDKSDSIDQDQLLQLLSRRSQLAQILA